MRHHPRREVLGNVTVQHPRPWVGGFEQNIHRRTRRHQHGVFADKILIGHAVHREHDEALAVQVHRILHAVKRTPFVHQADLDV